MKKILFVCLGNICRSPMGEGMLKHLTTERGISKNYYIDSAGTSAHHIGEMADERMRETAISHGIELTSESRQVNSSDFDNFDLILAMDSSNYKKLELLALANNKSTSNLKLMREFDSEVDNMDVPDPYYGGPEGFENVFNIIRRSCNNLLEIIRKQ